MKNFILPTLIFGVCFLFGHSAKAGVLSITMGPDFNHMIVGGMSPSNGVSIVVPNLTSNYVWTFNATVHKKKKNPTENWQRTHPIDENNLVMARPFKQKKSNPLDISFVDNSGTKTNVNAPSSSGNKAITRRHSPIEELLTNRVAINLPTPFRLPDKQLNCVLNRHLLREKRLSLLS